jgi:hypothetical protein
MNCSRGRRSGRSSTAALSRWNAARRSPFRRRGACGSPRVPIVHRDRPTNLSPRRSNGEVVKVLDFGIAKLVGRIGSRGARHHRDGSNPWNAGSEVTERLTGVLHDGRADVYSVGVLSTDALRPPFFPSRKVRARMPWRLLMTAEPRPIREVAPGIPEPVERVVRRRWRRTQRTGRPRESSHASLEVPRRRGHERRSDCHRCARDRMLPRND